MGNEQSDYDYEPFAATEEYRAVNQAIVRRWVEALVQSGTKPTRRVLDLATGTGTMVKLFLDYLPGEWAQPDIICLDMNEEALVQVRENLGSKVKNLRLLHSTVEDMDLPQNSVDVVIWGNGIHYLNEDAQQNALRNIRRTLRNDGWFFFNSAFCFESRPPETIPFYRTQIRKAVGYLRTKGIMREEKDSRPAAGNFLPESHYQGLLQRLGFSVEEMKDVEVRVHKTALEHISGFTQYAAGALHGYRPDAAAEAMRETVAPALEEHGVRDENNELYIPRNWMEVIARVLNPFSTGTQVG